MELVTSKSWDAFYFIKVWPFEVATTWWRIATTWRDIFGRRFLLTHHVATYIGHDVSDAADLNPNLSGFAPYLKEWWGYGLVFSLYLWADDTNLTYWIVLCRMLAVFVTLACMIRLKYTQGWAHYYMFGLKYTLGLGPLLYVLVEIYPRARPMIVC